MIKEQIFIIGELFMLNEFDDVNKVTYPQDENPPTYCIVELDNGIKLKVSIADSEKDLCL